MLSHHNTTGSVPRALPLQQISLESALQGSTEMQSLHDDFGDSPRDYVLGQLGSNNAEFPCSFGLMPRSMPNLTQADNTNVAEAVKSRRSRGRGSKKGPKQQLEAHRDSSVVLTDRAIAATGDDGKACTRTSSHASSAPNMDVLESWPREATTVMLRNIPNRYSAEEILAEMLSAGFDAPKFDFLYLPIDFTTKRNRGYCFINFRDAADAFRFVQAFHGERLTRYTTQKILEVSPAVTQGFEKNVAQYVRKDAQRIQNPWFRPMIFGDDTMLASVAAK